MSEYDTILVERAGRVARVSFNRPEKLNSFNVTQRREFVRAAQEVNADRDIWVVVLTGYQSIVSKMRKYSGMPV